MKNLFRLTCILVCTALTGAALPAGQWILFDKDLTWNGSGRTCFSKPDDPNATSNYRDWAIYVRVVVTEKPTDKLFKIKFCIWNSGETCGGVDAIEFTEPGTYYRVHFPVTWWKKDDKPIDWSTWGSRRCWLLQARNSEGKTPWADKKSAWYTYGPKIMDHLPVKMHATAIVVPLDNELDLPAKFTWDDCPDDWTCGDGFPETTARRDHGDGFTFKGVHPVGAGDIRISSMPSGALRIESSRHMLEKVIVVTLAGRSIAVMADGASAATIPARTLAPGVNMIAVQADGRTVARTRALVK